MNASKAIKLFQIDGNYPVHVRKAARVKDLPSNAMKCLPLSIASQYGYEILLNETFSVTWNGGERNSDIHFRWEEPQKHANRCAWANGGNGFVSFHSNLIIRTPVGVNTYVSGPPNLIRPGAQAMTALVETDWNMAHFSMNYKLTEPGKEVVFNKGEPFCIFFPVERKYEEQFDVKLEYLANDQDELNKFVKFRESMAKAFFDRQGHYAKGIYHYGDKCPVDHQTRLNVPDIKE